MIAGSHGRGRHYLIVAYSYYQAQQVQWKAWSGTAGFDGVQIGNAEQNVLGSKGDRVNIDWGYLHLARPADDAAAAKKL